MIKLLLIRSTHDELGGWRIPDCRALAGLSEPRRVLLSHVPTRFVLIPVVRSRQHDAALVPDDLLRIKESDAKQPVQNFAREQGSMPHVGNLDAWYEREGLGPVRP